MARAALTGLLLLVATLLVLWLLRPAAERTVDTSDLPWNIVRLEDGHTRVFGLSPGRSTLREAYGRFGKKIEAALFQTPGGELTLEAYYTSVRLSGLRGRLVLTLGLPAAALEGMRERSPRARRTAGGTPRYELALDDGEAAMEATIRSIGFIPAVDLDEETLLRPFGPPAERMQGSDGATHLLYPDRGLDILLAPGGKVVLQYVAPQDFQRVRKRIRRGGEGRSG